MTDTAAIFALILVILAVLFAVAALVTKAYQEGSLQADIRWVRGYLRLAIKNYNAR